MEKVTTLIQNIKIWMQSAGPVWNMFVILFAALAVLVWMDLFIGNRIRVQATGLIGIWLESFANWYSLRKNIAKANSYSIASGRRKRYWVIPIAGKYYVINNLNRKRINNILRKNNTIMNINDLLKLEVYHTK